ncbi:uncharacterized protein LOC117654137 isoform X2 [Thrips palmi]|uniref:Uncharacterized protein LOC117654137 isoform X2 n=1 Tax=Thrips palmi TaxID=161013 RepID=A0A6P9AL45_THRPL|nr:uncharacterized protein LOC117654137 isoform X2 [Thrips palmi]
MVLAQFALGQREGMVEWHNYLTLRQSGQRDFRIARRLLTCHYSDDELPSPIMNHTGTEREKARYEAELKFFDCSENRSDVESLLAQIVQQRYKRNSFFPSKKVVDLRDIPARRLIAAERLFQQKLIMLSGTDSISVGLDVGRIQFPRKFGPVEDYRTYHAFERRWHGNQNHPSVFHRYFDCRLTHRSESQYYWWQVNPWRLGDRYIIRILKYRDNPERLNPRKRVGIATQLQNTLRLDLDREPSRLVKIFKEFCSSHCVLSEREMRWYYKERLMNICFLILEGEQAQWQSACFLEGDDWKIGMSVSFARLIRLFAGGHINLSQLFFTYPIYSTQNLRNNLMSIRKTCLDIDLYYESIFNTNLDVNQGLDDLKFLYGNRR